MLVSVLALASGCAAKNWTLDEEGLANNLLESIKFDCTMYQVQTDRVADFIEIENTEKQILYMGNGAYADSLGIFTLADESSAQTALETVNSYLEDLGNSAITFPMKPLRLMRLLLFRKDVLWCSAFLLIRRLQRSLSMPR